MKAIGKIGVIIPEITDSLDFEVIDGMYSQSKALGYDLLLFTGVYNIHTDRGYNEYHRALDNIYTLPKMAELDAVILAGDRFKSEDIISFVDEQLRSLDIPKIMLNHPRDGYVNIYPEQTEYICRMTKHLIDEHNCRRIYCMAGIDGEAATVERLAGFKKAMDEAGLPFSDSDIFWGWFWHDVPYEVGKKIGRGEIERPDAVVCFNDIMASALIAGLKEYGISVPEDIAVTGYDGNWVSSFSEPPITTIIGRDGELGAMVISRIHEILTGEKTAIPENMQTISYRTSCGCKMTSVPTAQSSFLMKYSRNMVLQYYYRKEYITADFMTNVTTSDSLEQLIPLIKEYRKMINTATDIDICLCEDWRFDFNDTDNYRRADYSDNMISVLSENNTENTELGKAFPISELAPSLMSEHEPVLTVFTSLFCRSQIFGYTAVSFREASDICIDEYFTSWCDAVANGFRVVQEKMYRDYLQREIAVHSLHDPYTGLLNKRGLLEQAKEFAENDKKYSVLLIAYKDAENPVTESGFEPYQLIANAIRLTSGKNEIYARVSEHIFCIIMKLNNNRNTRNTAEDRVLSIEKEIRYMQGNMKNLFRSELVPDLSELAGCDMIFLDDLLIKHIQTLSLKVSGDVPFGNTIKEQLYKLRHDMILEPQKCWNIEDIAAQLGISASYLQHMYKSEFAVSCMDDVIMARIEKAKQLLTATDLRIAEIAEQCGYQSNRHFSRQFRQYTGLSPTDFRKQHN